MMQDIRNLSNVVEYADPAQQPKRPITSVMLTVWLIAAVAGFQFLFTILVPELLQSIRYFRLELPLMAVAIIKFSEAARSPIIWIFLYASAALVPLIFVRVAWAPHLLPYQYRYRRLVAIHVVITLALCGALLTLSALWSPFIVIGQPFR